MTEVYDKSSIIKSIQKFLLEIDDKKYKVALNGIYDDRTRNAVEEFQSSSGMNQTGVVDEATFNLLYLEYLTAKLKKEVRQEANYINFPILPGVRSEGMIEIHRAIAILLNQYGHTHNIRESNYFNNETKRTVNILQNIFLLDEIDAIDENLYFRIFEDLKSLNQIKKTAGK